MTARRRRGLSESEQTPIIITTERVYPPQNPWLQSGQTNSVISFGRNDLETEVCPTEDKSPNRKQKNTPIMTSRDRTTEFMNAIRSLQGRTAIRTVATRDPRKAKYVQNYAEFMMIARYVSCK